MQCWYSVVTFTQEKVRLTVDKSTVHLESSCYLVLRECEELREGSWHRLPDMQEERCCSSPCEYRGLLWICGDGSSRMEAFDCTSREFLQELWVPIPSCPCVLFVEGDELVALSRTLVLRWVWEGVELQQVSQAEHPNYGMDSTSTPVVDLVNRLVVTSLDGSFTWVSFDGDRKAELTR